ncbi:MAG: diphthamide synthesis protein, partial [Candidatus Diapherotrites archaeon]|nr:diphthamide synthesis protein [Candidatus Diapherotrites archaeon]
MQLEIDLASAAQKTKETRATRILLQFPEGLKTRANEFISFFESAGFEAIALVEPCFGACDINLDYLKKLGAQTIVHIGHEP